MTSRSSAWIVAVIAAIVVFGAPLIVAGAVNKNDPEIRVIRTGDAFTALFVTDDARALVVNSSDRRVTRSAIGLLARPWEPDPETLIAPADDSAASGIWEAMKHPAATQIVIVGLPGAEPVWAAIERESRSRDIDVVYVAEDSTIDMNDLLLSVKPATGRRAPAIIARHDRTTVLVSLDAQSPSTPSHVSILNSVPDIPVATDLIVAPEILDSRSNNRVIVPKNREVVRLSMGKDDVSVRGGRLYLSDDATN